MTIIRMLHNKEHKIFRAVYDDEKDGMLLDAISQEGKS